MAQGASWKDLSEGYFMPTAADGAVVGLRTWVDQYGDSFGPVWPAGTPSEAHVVSSKAEGQ